MLSAFPALGSGEACLPCHHTNLREAASLLWRQMAVDEARPFGAGSRFNHGRRVGNVWYRLSNVAYTRLRVSRKAPLATCFPGRLN